MYNFFDFVLCFFQAYVVVVRPSVPNKDVFHTTLTSSTLCFLNFMLVVLKEDILQFDEWFSGFHSFLGFMKVEEVLHDDVNIASDVITDVGFLLNARNTYGEMIQPRVQNMLPRLSR